VRQRATVRPCWWRSSYSALPSMCGGCASPPRWEGRSGTGRCLLAPLSTLLLSAVHRVVLYTQPSTSPPQAGAVTHLSLPVQHRALISAEQSTPALHDGWNSSAMDVARVIQPEERWPHHHSGGALIERSKIRAAASAGLVRRVAHSLPTRRTPLSPKATYAEC
jgi:hypothetical protein